MYLYSMTLQRATGVVCAVHGNFSGSKIQEIAVSRGKSIEILRADPQTGKIVTLHSVEVFGVVRTLMAFRLTGGNKGEE
jgi:splicing factor 3B subunit 3